MAVDREGFLGTVRPLRTFQRGTAMKQSLGAKPLIFPTPVWLVGTYDAGGRPNMMTAAWGGICCSQPPCVAVSLRKATYTHGNIVERKAFTINVPSESHLQEADYCGISLFSGRHTDKFAATGLTAVSSEVVDAPYVEEFPLVLECRLIHTLELGRHTHFVGEILDVKADQAVLDAKGHPDIAKVRPVVYAPEAETYHAIGGYLGRAFSAGKELARKA
jgi:flavin reductase (DIM6/NTAB) family NADH-FMN oxidoreductase RutF